MPPTTKRPRGRPPSGGREAILAATLEVLREDGIAHLTSREVAARAGVSDASVYYHFGDRAGLLRAAYEYGLKPLKVVEDQADLTATMAASFDALVGFFSETLPILHAAQADAELGQELAAYIAENDLGPHQGVARLGGLIREGQAAGAVNPDADPEAVALLLIDAAFARAARGAMLRPDEADSRLPSRERLLATLAALLTP
jgi:AcrR family transcriptional regulator